MPANKASVVIARLLRPVYRSVSHASSLQTRRRWKEYAPLLLAPPLASDLLTRLALADSCLVFGLLSVGLFSAAQLLARYLSEEAHLPALHQEYDLRLGSCHFPIHNSCPC